MYQNTANVTNFRFQLIATGIIPEICRSLASLLACSNVRASRALQAEHKKTNNLRVHRLALWLNVPYSVLFPPHTAASHLQTKLYLFQILIALSSTRVDGSSAPTAVWDFDLPPLDGRAAVSILNKTLRRGVDAPSITKCHSPVLRPTARDKCYERIIKISRGQQNTKHHDCTVLPSATILWT
jgi:hypothetical protein